MFDIMSLTFPPSGTQGSAETSKQLTTSRWLDFPTEWYSRVGQNNRTTFPRSGTQGSFSCAKTKRCQRENGLNEVCLRELKATESAFGLPYLDFVLNMTDA